MVPRVDGIPQPLCARYGVDAVATAHTLLANGARSMQALLDAVPVTWLDDEALRGVASVDALADVDTPEDARQRGLGFELPR